MPQRKSRAHTPREESKPHTFIAEVSPDVAQSQQIADLDAALALLDAECAGRSLAREIARAMPPLGPESEAYLRSIIAEYVAAGGPVKA